MTEDRIRKQKRARMQAFLDWALPTAVALAIFGLAGCSQQTTPEEKKPIVATVGDRPIELRRVTDFIASLHMSYTTDSAAIAARRKKLNSLIEEQLLIIGAYSQALDADIGIIELVDREKDKFLLDELYRHEVLDKAEVDPKEFDETYSHWFDRVRPMHILVKTKATADSIMAQLKAGSDFSEMAEKYSIDRGTVVRGGDFGREFEWGELMEPVQSLAFSLKEGEVGGPVQSEFGWHIVKVKSRRKLTEQSVDQVRGVINERLKRLAQERRRREQLDDVRSRANISFDDSALAFIRAQVTRGRDTLPPNSPLQPTLNVGSFPADEASRVLARYGTEGEVTVEDFAKMFDQRPLTSRPEVEDTVQMREFIFQMGLFDLLRNDALRMKLDETPVYRQRLQEFQEKLMADKMREKVVSQNLRVTQDDIRNFYDARVDSFVAPPEYHVREIMVGTEQEAKKILQEAKSGADFVALAKKYTKRPGFSKTGGDMGWVSTRRYGDLYQTAASLEVGQVGGPVPGVGQYSVIKVLGTRPATHQSFEDVQNSIFTKLQRFRTDSIVAAYVDSMKAVYPVTIHEDVLREDLPSTQMTEVGPIKG